MAGIVNSIGVKTISSGSSSVSVGSMIGLVDSGLGGIVRIVNMHRHPLDQDQGFLLPNKGRSLAANAQLNHHLGIFVFSTFPIPKFLFYNFEWRPNLKPTTSSLIIFLRKSYFMLLFMTLIRGNVIIEFLETLQLWRYNIWSKSRWLKLSKYCCYR